MRRGLEETEQKSDRNGKQRNSIEVPLPKEM